MKSLPRPHSYEDRCIDCQSTLEPLILDALDQAADAGWNKKETVGAIASVITNFLLADIANLKAGTSTSEARILN
jgi:hypothetical protein